MFLSRFLIIFCLRWSNKHSNGLKILIFYGFLSLAPLRLQLISPWAPFHSAPLPPTWNISDILSQFSEKIWLILPSCTTSEEVYFPSWRCYSVLFTLILRVSESLVIRGRKSLCCYHNCSSAGRSLTQDVMERPSHAQQHGPHGPLPRRNIHHKARSSWEAASETRPGSGKVCRVAAGDPRENEETGGVRGAGVKIKRKWVMAVIWTLFFQPFCVISI